MPESDRDRDTSFDLGVAAFNRGDFFEAHELWEEVWTQSKPPERLSLQALIHFAVGYYHHNRRNAVGAVRQLEKGIRKSASWEPGWRGIRIGPLVESVRRDRAAIAAGGRVDAFPRIERTSR